MNITLNTAVPEARRPQIESLVRSFAKDARIEWLPSRLPRIVMLIVPGPRAEGESPSGSIFASPTSGDKALDSVSSYLEERIQDCLAQPCTEPTHTARTSKRAGPASCDPRPADSTR